MMNKEQNIYVVKDKVYVNKGLLGEGQFGKVYEVYDKVFDNLDIKDYPTKALKIVPKKSTSLLGASLDDLKEEINIITFMMKQFPQCASNLLCYYEVAEDDNFIYFISEKLDKNLLIRFYEISPSDLPFTLNNIIIEAKDGLKSLHEMGIIHRDVKPENILLTNKDKVKIGDFGLSCFIEKCSPFAGTPELIHPEILFNQRAWKTSDDIFALALTALTLLSGQPLYNLDTIKKMITLFKSSKLPYHEISKAYNIRINRILGEIKNKYKDSKDLDNLLNFIKNNTKID